MLINCRDIVLFPQSFPIIDDSLTRCDTLLFLRLSVAWCGMDLCFILQDTVTLALFLLFGKFFGGKLPSIFSSGCPQGEFLSPPCVSFVYVLLSLPLERVVIAALPVSSVKGDESSGSSTGECGVGGVTPCSSDRLSRVGSVFGDGSLER